MISRRNRSPIAPNSVSIKTEGPHGLPRLVSDHGESVGMDERPMPPLSAYQHDLDRFVGEVAAERVNDFETS